LVGPDHPARAIWELVTQRDLTRFYAKIDAVEGVAGRPAIDPRLLISLWIYGYMDGTPSAREIAQRCEYHPAYQWLTGANPVCANTLSDYRTAHGEALKELATQVLALLAQEGMVDLEQVTQDGTKIRPRRARTRSGARARFRNTWSGRGSDWKKWTARTAKP
jgi:transposase